MALPFSSHMWRMATRHAAPPKATLVPPRTRSHTLGPCYSKSLASGRRMPVCNSAMALAEQPPAREQPAAYDGEIWGVALPALAGMLLEPVITVLNTGMIGQLGTLQLGAVSLASIVVSFAAFLFSFLLFLTTPEIAAAAVRSDKAEVSRISSKSIWIAVGFAALAMFVLLFFATDIIRIMAPPEPLAAQYAVEYVTVRAWGVLPVLVGFVATGTFRGLKDTRTPLYAAVGSATSSLVLTWLFLNVFNWGVRGGALAVVIAQMVSTSVLFYLLISKGMIHVKDLMKPPPMSSVLPVLRKGMVLGLRNIISLGMVMYASALCVRAGSSYQASFEVIRQVWMLTITFFECLNVATQALCSAYLGAGKRQAARAVLTRILQLGVTMAVAVGFLVYALQGPFVHFFTKDPLVISQALMTMPVVCLLFPLDAASSIMDGSLLAARQSDYMSFVHIAGSIAQFGVLVYLSSNNMVNCLTIWSVLKLLSVIRAGGGLVRNWFSPRSAYKDLPVSTTIESSTATASTPSLTSLTASSSSMRQQQLMASTSAHANDGNGLRETLDGSNGSVQAGGEQVMASGSFSEEFVAGRTAYDSELVEKRLRCYKQESETDSAKNEMAVTGTKTAEHQDGQSRTCSTSGNGNDGFSETDVSAVDNGAGKAAGSRPRPLGAVAQ